MRWSSRRSRWPRRILESILFGIIDHVHQLSIKRVHLQAQSNGEQGSQVAGNKTEAKEQREQAQNEDESKSGMVSASQAQAMWQ